jgi:hypothetical protein
VAPSGDFIHPAAGHAVPNTDSVDLHARKSSQPTGLTLGTEPSHPIIGRLTTAPVRSSAGRAIMMTHRRCRELELADPYVKTRGAFGEHDAAVGPVTVDGRSDKRLRWALCGDQ